MIWLSACVLELPVAEEVEDQPVPIAALWSGLAVDGTTVTVEAVVTSQRTEAGDAFYVQAPGGGDASGLRIELGAVLFDVPPVVGTPVFLRGTWNQRADGPELFIDGYGDLEILGEPGLLTPVELDSELELRQALVVAPGVTVTSGLDPSGHADTDGLAGVGGCFGVGPGYGRTGDLAGILIADRICARTAADWSGDLAGDAPLNTRLADVPDLPDGAWVQVAELLQATPWDRAGRWAVLQDPDGAGVWVDGEAWALPTRSTEGSVGTWVGEVRHDDDGVRLRTWLGPELDLPGRIPLESASLEDGELVVVTASGLGDPGPLGEILTAEGWILDDRFVEIDALSDPATVRAAVRGESRLAVLP